MPGFASRDDIISEMTVNGKKDEYNFYKIGSAPEAAGVWHTFWTATGQPGAGTASAGATPGTVFNSDSVAPIAGSMYFPDRSTDLRYLLSMGVVATQNCTLMLYDRLAAVSGISLSATGAKTVNSGALTRYSGADALHNQVWLELTAGTTTSTATLNLDSYTSADGSTGLAGPAISLVAGIDAGSMFQMPLAATDQGARSVEAGVNVSAASASGVANVVILRPLAFLGLYANVYNEISFLDDVLSLPRIYDNACLSLAVLATAATSVTVRGNITCVYG